MADLLDLPDEIIVHILSFLPSRLQVLLLSRVCQRLKLLVDTAWYWRSHYVRLCSGQPVLELDSTRLWQEACIQREFALACTATNKTITRDLKGALGGMDCVHILNLDMHGTSSVIAAGSRDADVYVWRKRLSDTSVSAGRRSMRDYTMATLKGHNGWVWSLASEKDHRPQVLCTGSWDRNIKVWDVSTGDCLTTFKKLHKAAVLSLCMPERDCLVSACFDKKVRVLDLRESSVVQMEHKQHHKSVLSVAASQNWIYSASEDATVCVWDRRNNSMLQKLEFSGMVPSLHLDCNMLSVATTTTIPVDDDETRKVNEVYLYSCPTGQLDEIQRFDTGHDQPITRVLHNLGMIATASKDGTVRLHTTCSPPRFHAVLKKQFNAMTDLDYHNNMLAVAEGGRTVSLWAA